MALIAALVGKGKDFRCKYLSRIVEESQFISMIGDPDHFRSFHSFLIGFGERYMVVMRNRQLMPPPFLSLLLLLYLPY